MQKPPKKEYHGSKQDEHGGLPDLIMLSVGMKVMVTFNIKTDLDIANRMRGKITKIVLNKQELEYSPNNSIVNLAFPPAYILVKMTSTKVKNLNGLQENIIPITPAKRTFTIVEGNEKRTITRKQLPLTPAYAFTDYHSQGRD